MQIFEVFQRHVTNPPGYAAQLYNGPQRLRNPASFIASQRCTAGSRPITPNTSRVRACTTAAREVLALGKPVYEDDETPCVARTAARIRPVGSAPTITTSVVAGSVPIFCLPCHSKPIRSMHHNWAITTSVAPKTVGHSSSFRLDGQHHLGLNDHGTELTRLRLDESLPHHGRFAAMKSRALAGEARADWGSP